MESTDHIFKHSGMKLSGNTGTIGTDVGFHRSPDSEALARPPLGIRSRVDAD
jgi:hypothetical protein